MPIDYSEYPDNWFTEIRPRILERAKNRCEWCGAENHKPHPDTGSMVVLTIAHLDHDHSNAEVTDDRLAALCQRCHLTYDAPRHHEKRRQHADADRGQLQLIDRRESMRMVEQHHYSALTD